MRQRSTPIARRSLAGPSRYARGLAGGRRRGSRGARRSIGERASHDCRRCARPGLPLQVSSSFRRSRSGSWLAALVAAGARVQRVETLSAECGRLARGKRSHAARTRSRGRSRGRATRALADPGAAIAIAVEDLASRRETIRARADEVLCPALQWPGRSRRRARTTFHWAARLAEVPHCRRSARAHRVGAIARCPLGRAAALSCARLTSVRPTRGFRARGSNEAGSTRADERSRSGPRTRRCATSIAGLPLRWEALERDSSACARIAARARSWRGAPGSPHCGWPGARCARQCRIPGAPGVGRSARRVRDARRRRRSHVARRCARALCAPSSRGSVFQPETPTAPIQIVGAARSSRATVRRACGWPGSPRNAGRRRRGRIRCCRCPGSASATFPVRARRGNSRTRRR